MAGRSPYDDSHKAYVYTVLVSNDYNVKRTAKETNTPENTVRRWRDEWKRDGPPEIDEEVREEIADWVARMKDVRDQTLILLRGKLREASPQQLATIFGILDDKIARAENVGNLGNEVHVQHHLPPAEELRELLGGFVRLGLEQANQRELEIEHIEDGELEEPLALPPAEQAG